MSKPRTDNDSREAAAGGGSREGTTRREARDAQGSSLSRPQASHAGGSGSTAASSGKPRQTASAGGGSRKESVAGVSSAAGGGVRRSKRQEERDGLHFFRHGARRLITSLLLYGLIVEWLLPLEQLKTYTELYEIGPLLAAVGLFLAVGLFVPPTWAALLLNGFIAVGTVLALFEPHYGSLSRSLRGLVEAIRHDALGMGRGDFMISGESRTLLLIGGLGMMAIAVQSLMWLRQWGLGLTALTALYLLLLYGFLELNVFPGLLRACAEGLLLSALVTVPRIERLAGVPDLFAPASGSGSGKGMLAGWSLGWWTGAAWLAVLIMAGSIGAAWSWSGPAASAQAPWAADAVKWGEARFGTPDGHDDAEAATTAAEAMADTGLNGSGKTGYGFDDSRLGGPLSTDDTVLFTVASREAGYLRGDSKSVYNGAGWEQDGHDWQKMDMTASSAAGDSNVLLQTVTPARPTVGYPLFGGGANARITALKLQLVPKGAAGKYWRDTETGALYAPGDEDRVVQYTVETVVPNEVDVRSVRAAGAGGGTASADDAAAFSGAPPLTDQAERAYTQLPAGLPARVGELAAQIIRDAGNPASRYEQAQAIADYLRAHYAYTLADTAAPEAGIDFVDDFLFRQKQGYCVHFASAMAVLLRTQGMPARYVKGFAPGEAERPAGGGEASLFTVRASNAHAWVEVWFPGAGWVPFEPTPGFAAPADGAAGDAGSSALADGAAEPGRAAAADRAAAIGGGAAADARG
ncbi:transglutaminase-like domain-containing protein, partial [Paenibacillus glycinis]